MNLWPVEHFCSPFFFSDQHWSGKKRGTKVFNWSEVHFYRSNFLQNPYFKEIRRTFCFSYTLDLLALPLSIKVNEQGKFGPFEFLNASSLWLLTSWNWNGPTLKDPKYIQYTYRQNKRFHKFIYNILIIYEKLMWQLCAAMMSWVWRWVELVVY